MASEKPSTQKEGGLMWKFPAMFPAYWRGPLNDARDLVRRPGAGEPSLADVVREAVAEYLVRNGLIDPKTGQPLSRKE